jgi:peroxiredoxin/outer membrane lipoprotein-sorting protein
MTKRAAISGQKSRQDAPSARKARQGVRPFGLFAACVVASSLLAAGTARAAAPSIGDILRKVGDVYSHLQSYHIVADREDTAWQAGGNSSLHSRITLDADWPGKVRMSLTGDGSNILIISDGKTTWDYAVRKNEYTETQAAAVLVGQGSRNQSAGRGDLLGQMQDLLVNRYRKLSQYEKEADYKGTTKVKIQGRKIPCFHIILHFKDLTDELWIAKSSYLVSREKATRQVENGPVQSFVTDVIEIKDFSVQPTYSPGFFTFAPPAKAQRVAALDLPGLEEGYMGSTPENFTLPDAQGTKVSLSDFRGKTVLLSFWATWCPPCNEELPEFQKIYVQHKDKKDIVVLAVDDEEKATISKFMKDKHYDFTALVDRNRTLFKKFAVHFIPTVFVINGQGIIVRKVVGWEGPQDLLAALKASGN